MEYIQLIKTQKVKIIKNLLKMGFNTIFSLKFDVYRTVQKNIGIIKFVVLETKAAKPACLIPKKL